MHAVTGLGYVGLIALDQSAFRTYATDVVGLAAVAGPSEDALYLKADDRQWRIRVATGETPGLDFIGWEVAGPTAFADLVARLEKHGVAVEIVDGSERGVLHLARFTDPAGVRTELFCGQRTDPDVFVSPAGVSAFSTGRLGLGHALVAVPDIPTVETFYTDVLGFRLTDLIQMGGGKSARFYRANERHHSLALMDLLPMTGMLHLMLEVATIDDVGRAYDRATDAGCTIVNHLGRHSNDRTFSFYMESPAGVAFEIGWGGLLIDEETWSVTEFSGTGDLWGHRGSMMDEIAAAREDG